ncbi:MAG: hypothetical protein NT170_04735 [Candidatus Moranbacteria bacterium]|nr:hypothetical protein [Candidatus Moranbacteria bacterium]
MKSKKPKKSKNLKKSKKSKKIKLDLFQEVCAKPNSREVAELVLVCAVVFGVSFLGVGKLFYNYSQENFKVLNRHSEIQIVKSAVAAEKNTQKAKEEAALKESQDAEAAAAELAAAKAQADKAARAKMIARQRAAELARINSAPVLAGPTDKLSNGLRTCSVKHDHPSGRGGKPHVDEDCCPDYDEYPNPRCEYSPSQMAVLKK